MRSRIVVTAVLALTACGKKIDGETVERAIEKMLAERGVQAGAHCPASIEIKRGRTFQCTAADSVGQQLVLDVFIQDKAGTVAINLAGTVVEYAPLLASVKETLGDPNATLACTSKLLVVTATKPAYCDVTTGGEQLQIEIVEDDRASHTYTWKRTGS